MVISRIRPFHCANLRGYRAVAGLAPNVRLTPPAEGCQPSYGRIGSS